MGRILLARRKSSSVSLSQVQIAEGYDQGIMPSRIPCPPAPDPQYCWDAQSLYGHSQAIIPPTEISSLEWPLFPSATPSCLTTSNYQYTNESFLDIVVDTQSLNGSSQESLWECPSPSNTTLNTPLSTCTQSFNIQETDCLDIMLSGSSQAHRSYHPTEPRYSRPIPQYLPGNIDNLKRPRKESQSQVDSDLPGPEKAPRTSSPASLRTPDMDYPDINDIGTPNGEDTDGECGSNSEPYAQLIYKALKSARNHSMVLKEIYEWFEQNTDKAKIAPASSAKGWQNSIRHNLSMNGVR